MTRNRDRAARLARIARAQEAVALSEQVRRASAERACEQNSETAKALINALSDDTPLHGLMVPAMARMLQANARDGTKLNAVAAAIRATERTERLRADRMAERAAAAKKADAREAEGRRLERLGMDAALASWRPVDEGKE